MSLQLPFDFVYQTAQGADDFVISDANHEVVQWIDRYPNWGAPGLIAFGPQGSGKTHLSRIWQGRSDAVYLSSQQELGQHLEQGKAKSLIIDQADIIVPEAVETVFHLYNRVVASGLHILFCAEKPLVSWNIMLPDLQSRLAAMPQVKMQVPDDTLLMGLFARQMAVRGVSLKLDLVEYALNRLPRSAGEVMAIATELDLYALQHNRALNMSLLREFFSQRAERA